MSGLIYVPVMRDKQGERLALKHLRDDQKKNIAPLFEIQPEKDIFDQDDVASAENAAEKSAKGLLDIWGRKEQMLLDLREVFTANGEHFCSGYIKTLINEKAAKPELVIGLDSAQKYNEIVLASKLTVVVRLTEAELEEGWADKAIKLALSAPGQHLVIDFGKRVPETTYAAFLVETAAKAGWKEITIVSGSFPKDVSELEVGLNDVERKDWLLWKKLQQRKLACNFGDYTITHPVMVDVDPKFLTIAAKIKYTAGGDKWLVAKGKPLKKGGFPQFHALSKKLVDSGEFKGASFSWGDAQIQAVSERDDKPGNMMTWVAIGINHHLAFVGAELASLVAVSVPA